MITTRDGTRIFCKDWGPKEAQPIMFHHGWPLSADDWDNQKLFHRRLEQSGATKWLRGSSSCATTR